MQKHEQGDPATPDDDRLTQYQYDARNRRIRTQHPDGSAQTLTYDGAHLKSIQDETQAVIQTLHYDSEGNLAGTTATWDNGSLTTITQSTPDRNKSLAYDSAGRLKQAKDAQNHLKASYRYDPLGRRIQKTTYDASGNPASTTYYLYSDEGLIGEYDATGAPIATYGHQPQSEYQTTPLWKKTNYGYVYYHRDHLGTPILLTDKSNATLWEARYRAFGERTVLTSAIGNNFGFPGQVWDEEAGLWQNWFRDYDHRTGRYVEGDPIGLAGGLNVYGYVVSNPMIGMDPFGLWCELSFVAREIQKHRRELVSDDSVIYDEEIPASLSKGSLADCIPLPPLFSKKIPLSSALCIPIDPYPTEIQIIEKNWYIIDHYLVRNVNKEECYDDFTGELISRKYIYSGSHWNEIRGDFF